MIRTLIVDDSRVVQDFMMHLLSFDPDIQIVGVASSGADAVMLVNEKHPDVITMDIHMPDMNGIEATRIIMETIPTPVVIVSGSLSVNDVSTSFNLFEAGALAVVLRPPGMGDPGFEEARRMLIQTLKLMSEVKVVKRFPKQSKIKKQMQSFKLPIYKEIKDIRLITIGASTGGPVVLRKILSNLPKELPVPVIIVQHIAKGFVNGFKDWLMSSSVIPISIAEDGELLKPGNGYIAPDNFQIGILPGPRIALSRQSSENGLCPSIDFFFHSVAEIMGSSAIGILLTGMGKDGAVGLKALKDKGAITIAQDEASCTVFGMPGEAIKIEAVDQVLSPEKIVEFITTQFNEKEGKTVIPNSNTELSENNK